MASTPLLPKHLALQLACWLCLDNLVALCLELRGACMHPCITKGMFLGTDSSIPYIFR